MTTKEKIAVMQAYEEGKKIEFRLRDTIKSTWRNTPRPCWDWDKFDYRIKPEEEKPVRMTNRQLAKWGAGNHGQVTSKDSYVRTYYNYGQGEDDVPVREEIRIRPWGSDEWIEPTVGIYNRDSSWHTGKPTEEGWYTIAFIGANERIEYASAIWCYGEWDAHCKVKAWQKIEPYAEATE